MKYTSKQIFKNAGVKMREEPLIFYIVHKDTKEEIIKLELSIFKQTLDVYLKLNHVWTFKDFKIVDYEQADTPLQIAERAIESFNIKIDSNYEIKI